MQERVENSAAARGYNALAICRAKPVSVSLAGASGVSGMSGMIGVSGVASNNNQRASELSDGSD